jgi:hypothetical protein
MPASPGDWTGPVSRPTPRPPRDSKGRDFSEMNSSLNETSSHNILLNYLNSFVK